jgi:hypothetical protein
MSLTWTGLNELKEALRTLPAELAVEAGRIVEARANGAAAIIKAGYHVQTGELRDKLTVTHTRSAFGAKSVVKNTSKYAQAYDAGTNVRHWASGKSTGRMWGKTPPTHLFARTASRERRAMYQDLADLLERQAVPLTVTRLAA